MKNISVSGEMAHNAAFRSVDEWKAALMTLPDNNFFELFRSVFGNMKTPFNKQKLLDDLFILLSRNETRKTISTYIDEQDHKVIAAVAILNEPVPAELEAFFAGEFSYVELYALLLNLEERLILYRFRIEGVLRLALNPVLEPVLVPFITDTRILFPFEHTGINHNAEDAKRGRQRTGNDEFSASACMFDGLTMAVFFAFILDEEELFKAEGGIRKKVLDEGKKLFPGLDMELAVRTLLCLGLFSSEGRRLMPCSEKIADYSGLSPWERQEYWAAGVYIALNSSSENTAGGNIIAHNEEFQGSNFGAGVFSRNRLRTIASFIHRFKLLIKPEARYPEITLIRLAGLLEREEPVTGHAWGERLFDNRVQLDFESVLKVMEKTGLLEKAGSLWKVCGGPAIPAHSISERNETQAAGPFIVMDTAFSFIVYPEIAFADALALGAFCSVKQPEGNRGLQPRQQVPVSHKWPDRATVCLELTRQSAVRGFDQGMDTAAMMSLLNRLSGNRLDENLGWTLTEWEKRYAGVILNQGIILTLAEDRRYLVEAEPVASLIQQTLAPGVYLLTSGEKSEAAGALRRAGVDIVAQPPAREKTKASITRTSRSGSYRNSFHHLDSTVGQTHPSARERSNDSADSGNMGKTLLAGERSSFSYGKEEAGSLREKFHAVLGKMQLTKNEKNELSARIERRLVLSEAQLGGTSIRFEKLEARFLDYPGKSVIAKQAIEAGSMVEVSWPGSGGVTNQVLGIAQALEKKEEDSILVIKPVTGREPRIADPAVDPRSEADSVNHGSPPRQSTAFKETIRIPLGKISLIRRIKQSIFGE